MLHKTALRQILFPAYLLPEQLFPTTNVKIFAALKGKTTHHFFSEQEQSL